MNTIDGVAYLMALVGGFGLLMCLCYFPMCFYFWRRYRKRGGRRGLWRYINEEC